MTPFSFSKFKIDNVIAYKGIPFVGRQPVGEYRRKAPVDFVSDDGKDYTDAQNLGLMDQMTALKWIHENISSSHSYFKRVIAQSGSPVFTRSTEQAVACTNELMKILGCKSLRRLCKRRGEGFGYNSRLQQGRIKLFRLRLRS